MTLNEEIRIEYEILKIYSPRNSRVSVRVGDIVLCSDWEPRRVYELANYNHGLGLGSILHNEASIVYTTAPVKHITSTQLNDLLRGLRAEIVATQGHVTDLKGLKRLQKELNRLHNLLNRRRVAIDLTKKVRKPKKRKK